VGHIELRDLDDDDLDAVVELLRGDGAAAVRAHLGSAAADRPGLDAWIERSRASGEADLWVVTESGGFAGVAGAFTVHGEREVAYAITSHARGRGVGTATLQLLAARDPVRPLYARVPEADAPLEAVRERVGFAEATDAAASAGVRRYVLPPTLE
jgi:RimJ/RimL family protein N-acetyltransferase